MSSSEGHLPGQTASDHCHREAKAPGAAAPSPPGSRERDIQHAQRLVDQTPDIREDRVAAAKQALRSGRLCLSASKLAERLFADDLHREDFSGA